MKQSEGVKPDIDELFEHPTAIDEALREGTRDALRFHKRMGNPVVVWRDGKIVWLKPEEIEVEEGPVGPAAE